ncbi:MAG: S24 family peptidase [Bacteroides sp.]|nr:S24 family peptidase [Bacteroides sp.]
MKEDLVLNVGDIVKRAKIELNMKKDSEFADYLGVSRSTLSNWIARNSIDFPLLLTRMNGVDFNWLLTGKGISHPVKEFCDCELASGEVTMLHTPKSAEPLDDRSVPLYNVPAAANLRNLMEDRPQYSLGQIMIPNAPRCDGAVYVSGDSMYPLLKSGDIVAFRCIDTLEAIIYGEMYLVSFTLGGDDHLVVKFINVSDKPGCIKLVSYNIHHEPIDLPVKDIYSMALVKFSIRRNTMM